MIQHTHEHTRARGTHMHSPRLKLGKDVDGLEGLNTLPCNSAGTTLEAVWL